MIKYFSKIKNEEGYTLLFAVLVSSVVLSIGISILTISKKEFLLSSSARDSTTALYAADSGLECAIYNSNAFSTSSPDTVNFDCMSTNFISDNPNPLSLASSTVTYDTQAGKFTFNIKMPESNACAVVTVTEFSQVDPDLSNQLVPKTTIESYGYNLGWGTNASGVNDCSSPSPRRVERALSYTF